MGFKIKLTLLFLFVLATSEYLYAQALQFEQVVTFSGNVNNTGAGVTDGPIFTCPAGKIWKVESLNFRPMTNTCNSYMNYKLNGSPIGVSVSPFNSNMSLPIWLKEGDTISPSFFPMNCSNMGIQSYFISILQFSAQ